MSKTEYTFQKIQPSNETSKLNKFLQFYRTSTMTYGHNFTYISDPQKTFV